MLKGNEGLLDSELSNCLKYDEDSDCSLCQEGFYLEEDEEDSNRVKCVESCGGDSKHAFLAFEMEKDEDYFYVSRRNVCLGSQGNSYIMAPDFDPLNSPENDYVTLGCQEDVIGVVYLDLEDQGHSIINHNNFQEEWEIELGEVYPEVFCPLSDDLTKVNGVDKNGDGSYDLVDNCEYYMLDIESEFGCARCAHGYFGKPKADTSFIDECVINPDCDSTVDYKNLDSFWVQTTSCHKCDNSSKIPYVAYKAQGLTDPRFDAFKRFRLDQVDWFDGVDSGNEQSSNLCLSNVPANLKTELSLSVDVSDVVVIENCGLGFLNLAYNGDDFNSSFIDDESQLNDSQAILCAACKPGHKATKHETYGVFKTECTSIENCEEDGDWFNACAKCKKGFVYRYDSKIKYDECVEHHDNNCLAFDTDEKECRACQKGYYLNRDFVCIDTKPEACGKDFAPKVNNNDAKYMAWSYDKGFGCNECVDGFFSKKVTDDNLPSLTCAPDDYVIVNKKKFADINEETTSHFIDHCS